MLLRAAFGFLQLPSCAPESHIAEGGWRATFMASSETVRENHELVRSLVILAIPSML